MDPGRLWYTVEGPPAAPWVTLLHSLATDHRIWDRQASDLAARHRVLRLDLRGHGASQGDQRPAWLSDLTQDVVAVWDLLGVSCSDVIGLSVGGMTALQLGLDHPHRVRRMVVADCRADAPPFFREMWAQRRALVREGGLAAVTEATLASWFTPQVRQARPELVARVRGMIESTSVEGYMAATHALMHLDLKRRLGEISRPVLYLCGTQDGPHPVEMRAMQELTPHACFQEIAAAGHLSNLEEPVAFNAAVGRWLERI